MERREGPGDAESQPGESRPSIQSPLPSLCKCFRFVGVWEPSAFTSLSLAPSGKGPVRLPATSWGTLKGGTSVSVFQLPRKTLNQPIWLNWRLSSPVSPRSDQAEGHMSVTPALKRQTQEDCYCRFEASLVDIESFKPTRAT